MAINPETLTSQQIKQIAHLARIKVTPEEMTAFEQKLPSILSMIDKMQLLDTSSVTQIPHPLNMGQRFREDVVTENNFRDYYQKQSKQTMDGVYLVPKVIE